MDRRIELAQAGDEVAFAELVGPLQGELRPKYGICRLSGRS
ncbi:hypothetical protein [Kribbella sp. NPDC051718]